jgi:hypothetical protein
MRGGPPRPGALHGDAGQPLEHLAHGAVAEALDLLAADDDLGGRGLAALLGVALRAWR